MFHPFSEKNKFGYYTVGDFCTYSKLEAFEVAQKTNKEILRHFNDEVFSLIDTTVEPPLGIWDYYSKRAQQIRDKYDYVVVMYSGGADSKTVVDSFVKNGIHIDEIAQFTAANGAGKNAFMDREVWKVAAPETNKLVDGLVSTKHRVIDVAEYFYKEFEDDNFKFDFIYQVNNFLHPLASIRTKLREYVKDWKEIIDSGKKLCLVWGGDKPLVHYNGKIQKHIFMFSDCIDNMVNPAIQQDNNPGWFDELFYWSPELPELPIKQAHILKNFLRKPDYSLGFLEKADAPAFPIVLDNTDVNQRSGSTVINGQRWFLKREAMHMLIYPTWDPTTFTDGKPPSIIIHPRDAWFWNDHSNLNTARKNFTQGIVKFKSLLPTSALKDSTDFFKGIKFINSRLYPLE